MSTLPISGTPIKISPSIAAGNLLRLAEEIKHLEKASADYIHFDCMDGHFVPNLTIGIPFIEQIKKFTHLPLDVHIMVSNPDAVFQDYLSAGSDSLTFHIESAIHAHRICEKIKLSGKRAGVALNPTTHWKDIEFLLTELDSVTIMTVDPGFSNQKHLSFVHKKISELDKFRKNNNLSFDIQVDGGVNVNNAAVLKKLGANVLIAGGAIFKESDYTSAILKLKQA
jgi:ribulose-phosphate 3-epimerase